MPEPYSSNLSEPDDFFCYRKRIDLPFADQTTWVQVNETDVPANYIVLVTGHAVQDWQTGHQGSFTSIELLHGNAIVMCLVNLVIGDSEYKNSPDKLEADPKKGDKYVVATFVLAPGETMYASTLEQSTVLTNLPSSMLSPLQYYMLIPLQDCMILGHNFFRREYMTQHLLALTTQYTLLTNGDFPAVEYPKFIVLILHFVIEEFLRYRNVMAMCKPNAESTDNVLKY